MKTKRPLLLLHGALGSEEQFADLKPLLSDTFDIHHFNFSGHGGKPFSEKGFSMDVFVDELDEFLDAQKLVRPQVFGYSMGGYVALTLEAKGKQRLGKIMTLGTKFDWNPLSAAHEVQKLNPDKIEEKVPAFAAFLKKRHAPNDWKELLNRTKEMMLALGRKPLLTADKLTQIDNECLISLGDADNMVNPKETQWAADHLLFGKYKKLENTPHPLESVDMQLLSSLLNEHLK